MALFCIQQTMLSQEIDSISNKLDANIERELLKGYINGFSVSIVNQDTVLYSKGFGYSDKKKNRLYTDETIQNIASISKTFIGIAILKAQEQGLINLDDPIIKYLPFTVRNPRYPVEDITIRHLATHTSSITDCPKYWAKTYIYNDSLSSPDAFVKSSFNPSKKIEPMSQMFWDLLHTKGAWYSKSNFTENKPGEIFKYSNTGAALAAYILEIATETNFMDFCKTHIFDPLQMTSTGWHYSDVDMSKHSKLYSDPQTELAYYHLITYPDGGLITSAVDLSKYLSELIKGYNGVGVLLSTDSYEILFTEQLSDVNFTDRDSEHPYNDEYNLGVFMGFSAKGFIGHGGGDPGVSTYMFFNKKTMLGRILIANTTVELEGTRAFYAIWDRLEEQEDILNKLVNEQKPEIDNSPELDPELDSKLDLENGEKEKSEEEE